MLPFVSTLRITLFMVSAINKLPAASTAVAKGPARQAFVAAAPSPE
jgi:hypothetical protein